MFIYIYIYIDIYNLNEGYMHVCSMFCNPLIGSYTCNLHSIHLFVVCFF